MNLSSQWFKARGQDYSMEDKPKKIKGTKIETDRKKNLKMSEIIKKNLKIILAITNSNQKNKYYIW